MPLGGGVGSLNKLLRGRIIEKVKIEQRIEGGEGIHYMAIKEKGIPSRGNCLWKHPEAEVCLAHTREGKEINRAGVESNRKRVGGDVVDR